MSWFPDPPQLSFGEPISIDSLNRAFYELARLCRLDVDPDQFELDVSSGGPILRSKAPKIIRIKITGAATTAGGGRTVYANEYGWEQVYPTASDGTFETRRGMGGGTTADGGAVPARELNGLTNVPTGYICDAKRSDSGDFYEFVYAAGECCPGYLGWDGKPCCNGLGIPPVTPCPCPPGNGGGGPKPADCPGELCSTSRDIGLGGWRLGYPTNFGVPTIIWCGSGPPVPPPSPTCVDFGGWYGYGVACWNWYPVNACQFFGLSSQSPLPWIPVPGGTPPSSPNLPGPGGGFPSPGGDDSGGTFPKPGFPTIPGSPLPYPGGGSSPFPREPDPSLGGGPMGMGGILGGYNATPIPTVVPTTNLGTVEPAALAADVNDYNPGSKYFIRVTTDGGGTRNITGLGIGQVDGQTVIIQNIHGVDTINLVIGSGSSAAANRFRDGNAAGNIALAPFVRRILVYDGINQLWEKIT